MYHLATLEPNRQKPYALVCCIHSSGDEAVIFWRNFDAFNLDQNWNQGQGCQTFKPKNTNLGKFCGAFDWKMLIYFTAICNILRTFWIIYYHLVYFGVFFAVLVSFTKKNLATLPRDRLYPQFFDTNNGHL
jgi:hypothetical protein